MATINISVTVPDNKAQELLDDFAKYYKYDANIHGTKTHFVKLKTLDWLRQVVQSQKLADAATEAEQEAIDAASSITLS